MLITTASNVSSNAVAVDETIEVPETSESVENMITRDDVFPPPASLESSASKTTRKKYITDHMVKWDRDRQIWEIETRGLPISQITNIAQSLHISEREINRRLLVMRNIHSSINTINLSLSDQNIVNIWSLLQEGMRFLCYKIITRLSKQPVQWVSNRLGRSMESTEAILTQIRDLKHYLHFAGIHHEPGSAQTVVSEEAVSGEVSCSANKNAVNMKTEHERQLRRPHFSLTEKQYIYEQRIKSEAAPLTACSELTARLGREEHAVGSQSRDLAICARDASMAVEEGLSLAPGADTQLWNTYMQTLPPKRILMSNVHLVAANIQQVANIVHNSFLQVQLRLQLIRTLKKFLHIAGVHNETEERQRKFQEIAPITQMPDNSAEMDQQHKLQDNASVSASMMDTRIVCVATEALQSIVTTTEISSVVSIEVAHVVDALVGNVESTADDVAVAPAVPHEPTRTTRELVNTVIEEVEDSVSKSVANQIQYNELLHSTVSGVAEALHHIVERAIHPGECVQNVLQGIVYEVECTALIRGISADVLVQTAHQIACNVLVDCEVAAVLSELTQQVEETLNSATVPEPELEPDNVDVEYSDSTSQQQSSLPLVSLLKEVLPFAFKLQDEGEIWRAYLQHQHQHDPSVNLCVRLTALSQQLGCSFAQIRDHLNKLINLQLGLCAQQHSAGRSFTPAEDTSMWAALKDTTPTTYAMAVLDAAQRLKCAVGAVAARHRQLRTLNLLDTVQKEVQSKNVLVRVVRNEKKKTVARSKGDESSMQVACEKAKPASVGTEKLSSEFINGLGEIAYFSTEGESGNE